MMFTNSPTQFSTLPSMPLINALPGGVPQGPWGPLYRAAPGAQIPSVRYPSLMGASLGAVPGVTLLGGLGLGQNGLTKSQAFMGLLLAAGLSAGTGAAFAMTLKSSRPVLYPSLLAGGMTLLGGLVSMMLNNGRNGAAPAA